MPKIEDFNERTQRSIRAQLTKPITDERKANVESVDSLPFHAPSNVSLVLVIRGSIKGGKNSVQVTRSGHRYPNPKWAKWRDEVVASIKSQLPPDFVTITKPVSVRLDYVAGDKRRRDQPAIIDSIWHCLEKAQVVSDDTCLWVTRSSRSYDKNNPRAVIEFV